MRRDEMRSCSTVPILWLVVLLTALGLWSPIAGQNTPQAPAGNAQVPSNQAQATLRPDYVLGANDQIMIRVPQAEEINERPFRIDSEGFVTLPIVGRVRAGGLTVQALEAELVTRLREFIRNPQVSISLVQFRSEPVFLVGAFKTPGIYPLSGRRTLVEMLTSAGGLQPNASRRIKVTRRADYGTIDLPNAVVNPEKKTSTIEISLESLTQNVNPEEDLVLLPYDIISVERAERVYVSGDVGKVGAIELAERDSISVAQALTEAGGFTSYAIRDKVRVLRPILGTNRRAEIVVDIKRVFEGKDIYFPLLPNDVLYVPRSTFRSVGVPLGTSFLGSIPYIIVTALLR
jgi:polysaccharide export outer membrane protein